jgi:TP901 family phage tail tape measure protein
VSTTIRAGVLLSLNDQFSPGLRKAGSEATSFGSGLTTALDKVNRATSGVAAKLGGLGLSIGAGVAVNGVIDLEARMERLGTAMNVSTEKMQGLKKKIFETAQAPEIKVDQGAIIDAIDQIGERTGDMKFAEENLRSIGMAIQATGASGADIGGLFSEFQKMGMGAGEAMRALDSLTKQGKEGAFTLQNLAGLGPRTISAYRATGRSGEKALREMGAALQVIRGATGTSEQAATSFEAVMRNLTDPTKQKELRKIGVAVRDQAGQFRPVTDIMSDIVVKSKGSIEAIGSLFDAEAVRAFNNAIAEFKDTGAVESLQKFVTMQGDGSTILADSARNASTLKANIQNLQGAFAKFADSNLTKPLGDLTDGLNKLAEDPERVQRVFKGIAIGLGSIVAVKGLASVVGLVSQFKGLSAGKAGALNLSAGLAGGGQPVFVTNWPGGLGGLIGAPGGGRLMGHASHSLGGGLAAVPALGRGAAALGAAKSVLGKAGLIGAGLVAVGGTIATLTDKDLSREEKYKGVGESIGTGGGGLAGAAAGAAIGTLILPGIGTAIGGLLGGAIGSWAGGQGGRALGGLAAQKDTERRGLAGQGIALDPELLWELQTQGLSVEAARGSMLPSAAAQAPKGEVRFLAETRITDERTMLSVTPLGSTVRGWSVNTGRAQEARDMP